MVGARIVLGPFVEEIKDEIVASAMAVEDGDVGRAPRKRAVDCRIHVGHQEFAALAIAFALAINHFH
jgi:hypothetical protein